MDLFRTMQTFWRMAAMAAFIVSAPMAEAAQNGATIVTVTGVHKLEVETADTPEQRETGLMNRRSMPADHGMLFEFGETRPVTMWMKNTFIPLDMLFMDERGVVTHIKERAKPESLDLISSGGPVRYVLELNGGAVSRYGIKIGSRLRHPDVPGGD